MPKASPATDLMVPNATPSSMIAHTFQRTYTIPHSREKVWAWLNDPKTFTEGQVWPWRVEFVQGGMEEGVLNNHHGPFINFAGIMGKIEAPSYRDLQYCYGSYAISFRWIRPTRLQFWLDDADASTTELTLQLDSNIKPGLKGIWEKLQGFFWARFPKWATAQVGRR